LFLRLLAFSTSFWPNTFVFVRLTKTSTCDCMVYRNSLFLSRILINVECGSHAQPPFGEQGLTKEGQRRGVANQLLFTGRVHGGNHMRVKSVAACESPHAFKMILLYHGILRVLGFVLKYLRNYCIHSFVALSDQYIRYLTNICAFRSVPRYSALQWTQHKRRGIVGRTPGSCSSHHHIHYWPTSWHAQRGLSLFLETQQNIPCIILKEPAKPCAFFFIFTSVIAAYSFLQK
jgi:hypothetical protein